MIRLAKKGKYAFINKYRKNISGHQIVASPRRMAFWHVNFIMNCIKNYFGFPPLSQETKMSTTTQSEIEKRVEFQCSGFPPVSQENQSTLTSDKKKHAYIVIKNDISICCNQQVTFKMS